MHYIYSGIFADPPFPDLGGLGKCGRRGCADYRRSTGGRSNGDPSAADAAQEK